MSESRNDARNAGAGQPADISSVLAQYVKDLSFENPGAPNRCAAATRRRPSTSAQRAGEPARRQRLEVELQASTPAPSTATTVLFAIELVYAGIFRLTNIPPRTSGRSP